MKNLFTALNVLGGLLAVALSAAIILHEPPAKEKILSKTPKTHNTAVPVEDVFDLIPSLSSPSEMEELASSNLFSSTRSASASPGTAMSSRQRAKSPFDLEGIFSMGEIQGAIIYFAKTHKTRFCTVGEPIGETGYKLFSVSPEENSVVLLSGTSRIPLVLDPGDDESHSRQKTARKKATKSMRKRMDAINKASKTTIVTARRPPTPPTRSTAKKKTSKKTKTSTKTSTNKKRSRPPKKNWRKKKK